MRRMCLPSINPINTKSKDNNKNTNPYTPHNFSAYNIIEEAHVFSFPKEFSHT